ncbi:hypothetical protein FHX08_005843 [Rhizobium sp. BK529]|nr:MULTISPECIES: hypothetical protein [unclassified Rhizobium]MBB3595431.1 hypothetical protein [Rhizobium sp. BK529]
MVTLMMRPIAPDVSGPFSASLDVAASKKAVKSSSAIDIMTA